MPLTVRLTPRTERALNAMAKRRRQTRSDVVREAIEHYTAGGDSPLPEQRPSHLWSDVIGIVRLGRRDPAKTTGQLFSDLVVRKARARRAR
jgi:Arc/MetJ-type ribon-helix-helix transcriptional regulator